MLHSLVLTSTLKSNMSIRLSLTSLAGILRNHFQLICTTLYWQIAFIACNPRNHLLLLAQALGANATTVPENRQLEIPSQNFFRDTDKNLVATEAFFGQAFAQHLL